MKISFLLCITKRHGPSPETLPLIGHICSPSSSYSPPRICKMTWLCSGFCSQNVAHSVVVVVTHDGFPHHFNPTCQKSQKFRRLHRALGELHGLGRQGEIQMPSPFHRASLQFQLGLYITCWHVKKRKSCFALLNGQIYHYIYSFCSQTLDFHVNSYSNKGKS